MPDSTKSQQPKLLDQVPQVLRLHHYSVHTERSYVDWIVRFVRFHGMRSREHLFPAEANRVKKETLMIKSMNLIC